MRRQGRHRMEIGAHAAGSGPRETPPGRAGDRQASLAFLLRVLAGWALATGVLSVLPGIDRWAVSSTVASVAWALRLASLAPQVTGTTIQLGHAALRIIPECTPVMPTLLLGIAMAAYPCPPRWRVVGVIAGAAALWSYNVVRMLALMATLAWWPRGFKFVHVYLWQTLTLLVVCALFMLWLRLGSERGRTA